MTANMYWRPAVQGKSFLVNSPRSFLEILGVLAGQEDCGVEVTLTSADVPGLKALVMTGYDDADAFQALIDALEEHTSIIVSDR